VSAIFSHAVSIALAVCILVGVWSFLGVCVRALTAVEQYVERRREAIP
jgi:hypothetical protein